MLNINFSNINVLLNKVFDKILYIVIRVDLCLLEFFGRKYTYLLFIFAFFVGNFDSSQNFSDFLTLFKFFCFLFSWYLVLTSILVFILFNIKKSKDYLNNLLGEDYVKCKISNPGKETFVKFTLPFIGIYIVNEVVRHFAVQDGLAKADTYLKSSTQAIDTNPLATFLR